MSCPLSAARPHPLRTLFALLLARFALLLALVWTLAGPASGQGQPPPTPVVGAEAETRMVVRRERVIGSLRAARRVELAAREEGPLVHLAAREGQRVSAGDVLTRVDTRRLAAERAASAAELATVRATLIQREAEVGDATEDLARFEQAGEGAVSERELERARTALAVAEARRDAAKSTVASLEARVELFDVRLSDATLLAPFDAVVVRRHREEGEWVSPGDPLLTVVTADRQEAWLAVPERLVGEVGALPLRLLLTLEAAGSEVVGTHPRVVPEVDPVARTFTLIADVADSERRLAAGLSVSAWLPVGEPAEHLLVPKDALIRRAGGVAVVTVPGASVDGERAGAAVQVPVQVLFELEREVALVRGAVQPGALVVTQGNERVFPGAAVRIRLPGDGDSEAPAGGVPEGASR